ncbi:MAG: c-type cytochrome [Xanthomonadales bacterium]|nr:c-type cytochrome [Gammaproteobacteria bacterium]MBT8053587.1 c-type cytochrome [Gammaproteobacteria bacterium]NND57932.1 c-type cytochrome [Xanthomonadales bacterium]NNK50902.1 c-type cytochrome [Xanthomonadales bacterium]
MRKKFIAWLVLFAILLPISEPSLAALSEAESAAAAADYQKYCALCHGADRQGYLNDHAPSLRSESLIRSGFPTEIKYTIGYGRRGTPMGAYSEEMGGPLSRAEIDRLARWLKDQVGVEPLHLSTEPVSGDIDLGATIYAGHCAQCHGGQGEGVTAPAIGNPAMLSLHTDEFLKYAIENGRDGTEMRAFRETLSADEINGVTAFLRTRATGWVAEQPALQAPPKSDRYILNPDASAPDFKLKDGRYVLSEDLYRALQDKRRMVLLDTRVTSMWQMAHIAGSVPIPYYYERYDQLVADLPDDGTWIITYCECPRAAAESVNERLREFGLENTAVLWEGIQGWVTLGYPVSVGQTLAEQTSP